MSAATMKSCLFPNEDDSGSTKDAAENDGRSLLVLDQHDLSINANAKSNKTTNKTTSANDTRNKLMLMKIPKGLKLLESFQENAADDSTNQKKTANCYMLSNKDGSTLVCNDTSYSMSIVGTSNALVLVPPPPKSKVNDTDEGQPSPTKKLKTNNLPVCNGRLVHVGGSGASFIELRERKMANSNRDDIINVCKKFASGNKLGVGSNLSFVSLELQCSMKELLDVLDNIPVIVPFRDKKCDAPKESEYKYIILDESQVYDGYNAILSTLCEANCCIDHASVEMNGRIPIEETVTENVTRFQQDDFKLTNEGDDVGMKDSDESTMLRHVARHLLLQLRKQCGDVKQRQEQDKFLTLDAEKIAKWVWDILWIEKSTWKETDILSAFHTRLPGIISPNGESSGIDDVGEAEAATTGQGFYHSGLIPTQKQFNQVATRHLITVDDHGVETDADNSNNKTKIGLKSNEAATTKVVVWKRK